MANKNLAGAKRAKNDEFYTQYEDINKEVQAYLEYDPNVFRGKTVYCNCDDPYTSNFFKFFALGFNHLGLKRLIAASYDPSPIAGTQLPFEEIAGMQGSDKKAYVFDTTTMPDLNKDGAVSLDDTELLMKTVKEVVHPLKGNGDFRSSECIELLKQADIVVTNPPFSLFREYIAQLVEHGKQFLIIGNMNAITYKEVFPLIKENKVWFGPSITSGDREFRVPDYYPLNAAGFRVDEKGVKYIRVKGVRWFTNLDHGRRHEELMLMTLADNLECSRHKEIRGKASYDKYDNYDAIEVPYTDAIPSDCEGVMGVPISFLDKYNPEQFEIVGLDRYVDDNPHYGYRFTLGGNETYARILIRHKKGKKEQP
ncbi:MAG: adenine-specific methyltransferase EcoRI family protein [Treponematales bacterium]